MSKKKYRRYARPPTPQEVLAEAAACNWWNRKYEARLRMIGLIQEIVEDTRQTPYYLYDYYSRLDPLRKGL